MLLIHSHVVDKRLIQTKNLCICLSRLWTSGRGLNVCKHKVCEISRLSHCKKMDFDSQYCMELLLLFFTDWQSESERERTLNEYEMKNGFSVMCGHIVDGYTHFWIARQWKIVMKSHFVLCHTNKSIISLFMTLSLAAASTDCSVTYCQYQFAHSNRLNYFELVFIAVGWMNIKKLFYGISKVQFREIDMIGFYQ